MKLINQQRHIPLPELLSKYVSEPDMLNTVERAISEAWLEQYFTEQGKKDVFNEIKAKVDSLPVKETSHISEAGSLPEIQPGQIWKVSDYFPALSESDTCFLRPNENPEGIYGDLCMMVADIAPQLLTYEDRQFEIVHMIPLNWETELVWGECRLVDNYMYTGIPFLLMDDLIVEVRSDCLERMLGTPKEEEFSDNLFPDLRLISESASNFSLIKQQLSYLQAGVTELRELLSVNSQINVERVKESENQFAELLVLNWTKLTSTFLGDYRQAASADSNEDELEIISPKWDKVLYPSLKIQVRHNKGMRVGLVKTHFIFVHPQNTPELSKIFSFDARSDSEIINLLPDEFKTGLYILYAEAKLSAGEKYLESRPKLIYINLR